MVGREIRFGVGTTWGAGHRYWTVRASVNRPEVFIRDSRTGAFFGVRLHEHPDYWQWKARRPGEQAQYQRWRVVPVDLPDGYWLRVAFIS